ncbi:hypothetical protein Tco_1475191 [Tanacetum coccineum]
MTHGSDVDMEYDPSNVEFTKRLASKFYNHKTMDQYTNKALWIYWTRGDDEVELTNVESSYSDDDGDEVAKIFRIDTNVFDFETPTCRAFKEFNYLLQIDPDVLTKDIDGFKTYKEYNDDWIYEWNKDIPRWKYDGYCNGGNFPGAYIVGNTLRYQDLEWYEALEDGKLKDEALKNKAAMKGIIDEDDESHNEGLSIRRILVFGYDDLAGKEIDKVGEVAIIWNPMCVVVMLIDQKELLELEIPKCFEFLVLYERNKRLTLVHGISTLSDYINIVETTNPSRFDGGTNGVEEKGLARS